MRYGYFDNDNREYVIDRVDVPVSWTNYIGLKDMAWPPTAPPASWWRACPWLVSNSKDGRCHFSGPPEK